METFCEINSQTIRNTENLRKCCVLSVFTTAFSLLEYNNTLYYCSVTEWETAPAVAESPEIKLFGKWSTDDVQINDISLQVSST